MGAWTIDILVGWVVGSIVGGFAWDLITGGSGQPIVGVVIGTAAGIFLMRRRRLSN